MNYNTGSGSGSGSGLQNTLSNVASGLTNAATNVATGITNVTSNVASGLTNVASAAGDTLRSVSSNYRGATREFFDSNSLVAKIAFLLLVLVGFTILLRLGIWLIGSLLISQAANPRLIDGMIDAKTQLVIQQDPKMPNSINVSRSANQNQGIEFTWSCWMFINDLVYNTTKYRCVFYKGNDYVSADSSAGSVTDGLNFPNNSPGLYISPNTNNLEIFMNTFNNINRKVTINEVPLKKWMNIIIRCKNTTIDIYINGDIAKSLQLDGVPKQNYGNVFVAPNGGFDGYISNLWYYDYALNPIEITALVAQGPNTKMIGSNAAMNAKDASYLSLRWFFAGESGGYNP
jgi:hypothetical protein